MKTPKFLPALVLALLVPFSAVAAETPLGAIVKALEAPFRGNAGGKPAIRDFQAEFTQLSRLVSLDRSQSGRGRVQVKFEPEADEKATSTKFRWDYTEPNQQEIVSDGRFLWVYLPENAQAIQTELEAARDRPEDPMTFLTGLDDLSRDFEISRSSPPRNGEGNFLLDLTPRCPSPVLQSLQVEISQEAVAAARQDKEGSVFPLRSIVARDPGGNSTRIEFQNVRVNQHPPDDLFRFDPPPGVEIVRPALDQH